MSQQTRDVYASVAEDRPTLTQHWVNVSCSLDYFQLRLLPSPHSVLFLEHFEVGLHFFLHQYFFGQGYCQAPFYAILTK